MKKVCQNVQRKSDKNNRNPFDIPLKLITFNEIMSLFCKFHVKNETNKNDIKIIIDTKSVVFTKPNCVHQCKLRLFVAPKVS